MNSRIVRKGEALAECADGRGEARGLGRGA